MAHSRDHSYIRSKKYRYYFDGMVADSVPTTGSTEATGNPESATADAGVPDPAMRSSTTSVVTNTGSAIFVSDGTVEAEGGTGTWRATADRLDLHPTSASVLRSSTAVVASPTAIRRDAAVSISVATEDRAESQPRNANEEFTIVLLLSQFNNFHVSDDTTSMVSDDTRCMVCAVVMVVDPKPEIGVLCQECVDFALSDTATATPRSNTHSSPCKVQDFPLADNSPNDGDDTMSEGRIVKKQRRSNEDRQIEEQSYSILTIPSRMIRERILEACKEGAEIQLTVRHASTLFSDGLVVADAVEVVHVHTKSSNCIECGEPGQVKPRCRRCYAAYAARLRPSNGPGICRNCDAPTAFDWHRFCTACCKPRKLDF